MGSAQPEQRAALVGHGNCKAPQRRGCLLPLLTGSAFHQHVPSGDPAWTIHDKATRCKVPHSQQLWWGWGTSWHLPGYSGLLLTVRGRGLAAARLHWEESSLPILLLPPKASISVCKTALLPTPARKARQHTSPPVSRCGLGTRTSSSSAPPG